MRDMPEFISYFTVGTPYAELARRLSENLQEWKIPHDFRGLPDTGNWCQNCALKGPFVLDMMKEKGDVPLVWIDLDAEVAGWPTLFQTLTECDMAVFIRDRREGQKELISNIMMFNPTPKTKEVVKSWAKRCREKPNKWDQKHLQEAVEKHKPNWELLPPEYNARYRLGREGGYTCPEPHVIRQFQCSRVRRLHARDRAHPEMLKLFLGEDHGKVG